MPSKRASMLLNIPEWIVCNADFGFRNTWITKESAVVTSKFHAYKDNTFTRFETKFRAATVSSFTEGPHICFSYCLMQRTMRSRPYGDCLLKSRGLIEYIIDILDPSHHGFVGLGHYCHGGIGAVRGGGVNIKHLRQG